MNFKIINHLISLNALPMVPFSHSSLRSNPVATAWLTACLLLYIMHVVCILANWYGVIRSRPLWMIPKLVLKLLTILICISSTCAMGYLIWVESPLLRFLVAKSRDMEYYAAKSTMAFMGAVLFVSCFVFSILQCAFLKILLDCFGHVEAIYTERLVDEACLSQQLLQKQQHQQQQQQSNNTEQYF